METIVFIGIVSNRCAGSFRSQNGGMDIQIRYDDQHGLHTLETSDRYQVTSSDRAWGLDQGLDPKPQTPGFRV